MGNCCQNLSNAYFVFLSYIHKTELSETNFSNKNDNFFFVPKDYQFIISELKNNILPNDTSLWINYQNFLKTSQNSFNKLLTSLISYQSTLNKENNIPFDKIFEKENIFPKKYPKKFIIDIQKAVFSQSNKNISILGLNKPYIEIEIYPDEKKNPDRVIFFQTKTAEINLTPEWNELFVYEFENEKIKETGKFCISLYYIENFITNPKKLVDQKFIFEFSEINNQIVNEKNIRLRDDNNKYMGDIYFRVQLIHDYEKFLGYWIRELEVKLEIIERVIKVNEENLKKKKVDGNRLSEGYLSHGTVYNHRYSDNESSYIEMNSSHSVKDRPTPKSKSPQKKKPTFYKVENLEILMGNRRETELKEIKKNKGQDNNEFYENSFVIK